MMIFSIGKILEKSLGKLSFFSKTAGLYSPALPKNELFYKYFSEILTKSSEYLCYSQWLLLNTNDL